MRTRVFAYKNFLGVQSSFTSIGLLNKPGEPGQLGFVMDAKEVFFSLEAIELLKKVKRSRDAIGDVDVFQSDSRVVFAFLGGPLCMYDATQIEGSRSHDAGLLEGLVKIVQNLVPQSFIDAVEGNDGSGSSDIKSET